MADHPAWNVFCAFCEENGIDLEHHTEWNQWWKCFEAGYNAGVLPEDEDDKE